MPRIACKHCVCWFEILFKRHSDNRKRVAKPIMTDSKTNSKIINIAARCRGPGPAKYLLPGTVGYRFHDFSKTRAPAFVFGQRHKEFQTQFSPGPTYMIPASLTCTGKDTNPAYSLYSRPVVQMSAQIPGPGTCKALPYRSGCFTGK